MFSDPSLFDINPSDVEINLDAFDHFVPIGESAFALSRTTSSDCDR